MFKAFIYTSYVIYRLIPFCRASFYLCLNNAICSWRKTFYRDYSMYTAEKYCFKAGLLLGTHKLYKCK